ncbi:MAG TPA: hypothetical protein VEP90_08075 [Methylomirabilota bacterium]|nr:hypothetical protein [Methylomirabilota bacterium]
MSGNENYNMAIARKTGYKLRGTGVPLFQCFIMHNIKWDVNDSKSVITGVILGYHFLNHHEMGKMDDEKKVDMKKNGGRATCHSSYSHFKCSLYLNKFAKDRCPANCEPL